MMVRSPNPKAARPYRRFHAGNRTLLPNPQPSRSAQHPSMTVAVTKAMDNTHQAAPTVQTVVINPRPTRAKTIARSPNPHSPSVYRRIA